ncbi:MAG: hypothetical protein WAN69_11590, partial [Candidatus Korobacteraceae bacterium]
MPNSDFRRIGRWMPVFTVLAALSLAAALTVGRRSMRMSSAMAASANPTAFAELAPGSKTQAVVEITAVDANGNAEGKLLDRESDDLYQRTRTPVGIKFSDATPAVMGKLGDVHAGAVVH